MEKLQIVIFFRAQRISPLREAAAAHAAKKEYFMQKFLKQLFTAPHSRRAMFFVLFAAVMLLNSSPELRANALYLIADGDAVRRGSYAPCR